MQEHMHHNRRLLIALALAGCIVGFGTIASPASADVRVFEVKLLNGASKTVTLNIPASTPLSAIKIPGLNLGPLLSIKEITSSSATTGGGLLQIAPAAPAQGV